MNQKSDFYMNIREMKKMMTFYSTVALLFSKKVQYNQAVLTNMCHDDNENVKQRGYGLTIMENESETR